MITPPTVEFLALSPVQSLLWCLYLVAAVALPAHHIQPIRRYLRGDRGIGDACLRSETLQCLWRLPALLFAVFVAPSLPLFLSIALDMVGRAGRILAMRVSQRRWQAEQARTGDRADSGAATEPAALQIRRATLSL